MKDSEIDLSQWQTIDTTIQPVAELKYRNAFKIAGYSVFGVFLLLIVADKGLQINIPHILYPVLMLSSFLLFILCHLAQKNMLKAPPSCDLCHKPLEKMEIFADPDNIPFYFGATKVRQGKYGHCYVLIDTNHSGGTIRKSDDSAFELRKLFLGCEGCKRYIMVDEFHKVLLEGKGEAAIENREQEIENIRSAIRGLKGKRIVVKNRSNPNQRQSSLSKTRREP